MYSNMQTLMRGLFVGFLVVVVGTVSAVDVRQLENAAQPSVIAAPIPSTSLPAAPPLAPAVAAAVAVESRLVLPPATLVVMDPTDAAADALARIGTPAVRRVSLLLQDPNPRVRERGAEILGKIGPEAKATLNELIYLLNDPDPGVRVAAANALGSMGVEAAGAVPKLIEKVAQAPTR